MPISRRDDSIEKQQPAQEGSDNKGGEFTSAALSLLGEEGKTVALNMARISLGAPPVETLKDERYYVTKDGVPGILIDEATAQALEHRP